MATHREAEELSTPHCWAPTIPLRAIVLTHPRSHCKKAPLCYPRGHLRFESESTNLKVRTLLVAVSRQTSRAYNEKTADVHVLGLAV